MLISLQKKQKNKETIPIQNTNKRVLRKNQVILHLPVDDMN